MEEIAYTWAASLGILPCCQLRLYFPLFDSLSHNVPSGNCISSLNRPPSHSVFSLPGIAQSQRFRSSAPWGVFIGLATKPKGWSLRHVFLSGVISSGLQQVDTELTSPPAASSGTETC